MGSLRAIFSGALSAAYFFTNVAAAHAGETGFWEQRRAARRPDRDAGLFAATGAAASLPFDRLFGEGATSSQPSPKILNTPLGPDLGAALQPFGAVGDVRAGAPGAPLVVLIQDVHTEDAAQVNIGRLLGALAEKGVTTAALEGAWVPLETERFRRHPSPPHLARAAEYFRAEGYLSGPEWAALALPQAPALTGVEDKALYYDNVRVARRCVAEGPRARAAVEDLRRRLAPLKKRVYTPALVDWDARRADFHAGRGKIGDYARFLAPHATGPSLRMFIEALDAEARLDFARAERERRRVLEQLTARSSPEDLTALLREAQSHRAGALTAGEFNERLRRAQARAGLDPRDTPAFAAYLDYVARVESIQRARLLDELLAAEKAAGRALAPGADQRRLMDLANDVDLLARLTESAMTPSDWAAYAERRRDIAALGPRVAAFAGAAVASLPDWAPFEAFCEKALARNDALVANTLRLSRRGHPRTLALVAGGFHTEGILARLKAAGASVAVVTPRFDKATSPPLDVFARDPLPLEKIFAGQRINLPRARVLVPLEALDPSIDGPRAAGVQAALLPTADALAQKDGAPTMAGAEAPAVTVALDAAGQPRFSPIDDGGVAGVLARLGKVAREWGSGSATPKADPIRGMAARWLWEVPPGPLRTAVLTDREEPLLAGLSDALALTGHRVAPDSREERLGVGRPVADWMSSASFDVAVVDVESVDPVWLRAAASAIKSNGVLAIVLPGGTEADAVHRMSELRAVLDPLPLAPAEGGKRFGFEIGSTSLPGDYPVRSGGRDGTAYIVRRKPVPPPPLVIASDVLGPRVQRFDLFVHQKVNPGNRPLTVLEGAGGNDIVRPFLSLNPGRLFAVTRDPRFRDVPEIRAQLTRPLSTGERKILDRYVKSKGVLGWSTAFDVEGVPFGLALRAELRGLGVDPARAEVSGSAVKTGALVVRFPWRHPTEHEETTREIIYWRGDITDPSTFEGLLESYDASIDVYRHSAAMDVPAVDYPRGESSFLNFIARREAARRNGTLTFVTGDVAAIGNDFSDHAHQFPVPGTRLIPRSDFETAVPKGERESWSPGVAYGTYQNIRTLALGGPISTPGEEGVVAPAFRARPLFVFDGLFERWKSRGGGWYAAYVFLAVLVAPVIEEYLFRHLVFGGALEAVVRAVAGEVPGVRETAFALGVLLSVPLFAHLHEGVERWARRDRVALYPEEESIAETTRLAVRYIGGAFAAIFYFAAPGAAFVQGLGALAPGVLGSAVGSALALNVLPLVGLVGLNTLFHIGWNLAGLVWNDWAGPRLFNSLRRVPMLSLIVRPGPAVSTDGAVTDQRPVQAGLLHPAMVKYRTATRRHINPDNRPTTVLYGGAGADVSGALLDTNGSLFYFLDTYGPLTVEDLNALKNPPANAAAYADFAKEYRRLKKRNGYTPVGQLQTVLQRGWALRTELADMGVDLESFTAEEYHGRPSLAFSWAYAGQSSRRRRLVFVNANLFRPETYQDVLGRGVDVYLQRAALTVPNEYKHPPTFLRDIAAVMSPGGVMATDDVSVDSMGSHADHRAEFPLAMPISRMPGEERLFADVQAALREGRAGSPVPELSGYGNRLNIRFAPFGKIPLSRPSAAPGSPPRSAGQSPVTQNKLLATPFVEHDLAVRAVVNPRRADTTVLYGGAGADVTNVMLTWDPARVYMIAPYPGLTVESLRAALSEGPPPIDTVYSREKFSVGYSRRTFLSAPPNVALAIAIEIAALDVPFQAVEVLEVGGRPAVRFPWEGRERTVVFHDGLLENTAAYRDVLDKGLDGFYTRAGMTLATAYVEKADFLFAIAAVCRPGGFLVTDDAAWQDTWVARDYGASFPFPAEEIPIPREEVWGPLMDAWIEDLSGGQIGNRNEYRYGWGVRVRRLTSPVQSPPAHPAPDTEEDLSDFGTLAVRPVSDAESQKYDILLNNEPVGTFRWVPQDEGVWSVEDMNIQLRFRMSPRFRGALFRHLARHAPDRELQFSAGLWIMALYNMPQYFDGQGLRAMFQKDLQAGIPWDHAPAWNSAAFLERLKAEGIPFLSNEVLSQLVLRGRVTEPPGPPAGAPTEAERIARIQRFKPSDVPIRLLARASSSSALGPNHRVVALDGQTIAWMRLELDRSIVTLSGLRLRPGWPYPADIARVFDLALAWARRQGAREMVFKDVQRPAQFKLMEGQFGPGQMSVRSTADSHWRRLDREDFRPVLEGLATSADPAVSPGQSVHLRAPLEGILYRGTTVSHLRKNLAERPGGGVRLVGGRAAFHDAPFFSYKWEEARGYAFNRRSGEDPAVVIEVGHDALAAWGVNLPSLTDDHLPAQSLAGGVPLETVRALSVYNEALARWERITGVEKIRAFVFAKAAPLREVKPRSVFVSPALEVNPPHELDAAIDRLGIRPAWDELSIAVGLDQASRYFNGLYERLQGKLSDPSPLIRRQVRTVLSALPVAGGRLSRPTQRREERRLWRHVMRDPLSEEGQRALETLRVWGGVPTTERAVLVRLPDLAPLEAALWEAAERTSEYDALGFPVRADIIGGSRYRFSEHRPDVDVLLSYQPDDPVVANWIQPRTVYNVFLRELSESLPAGSRVETDRYGAIVTLRVSEERFVRFELNIHPHPGSSTDGVTTALRTLALSSGRDPEALDLEREYYLGENWVSKARIFDSAPSVPGIFEPLRKRAAALPEDPGDTPAITREQIEKRLNRPASVLLLPARWVDPKPMLILEPFLSPLRGLGRSGSALYAGAVLIFSAAEEWFFRQLLLGDAVAGAAPLWLGFLGEGFVYTGVVLLAFVFLHPILRGVASALFNPPGRRVVPPEGWIDTVWRTYFGGLFTVLYFMNPEGIANILAHTLVNLWVMSQHREVAEGQTPSRPWPLMSILMGTPPEAKPAPIAEMKKSQFDLERFVAVARRSAPRGTDAEGRSVPAKLVVMGGDWDATMGPPAEVRLILDLGEKANSAETDQKIMIFLKDWLAELKTTDVVESADTVVGPRTYFRLVFPSQGGKRVWSIPVHVRVVAGDPLAAAVSDLEFQPRDFWDRIRRVLRAEWLFGNPADHARWLKTFHEQKKLNRAGEVFDADPAFRAAMDKWRNPRAAVASLGLDRAKAVLEEARDRRLPGTGAPPTPRPAGPLLRENPDAVRGFLDLLMEGSRLDKNLPTAELPAEFRDALAAFSQEGFVANPSGSGRWDLFYRGVRRYFRFVKLAGAPYWTLALEWRPGWGLLLSMTDGKETRIFLVNNYTGAMAAKPTVVLSPQAAPDLGAVAEETRLQNARVEALRILERAVRAVREGREAVARDEIEKDMDAFNASAPPLPVGARRKGARESERLLTLVRGDNRRLNFQNQFLTDESVRVRLLWPRGHHPVALVTRGDGRTLVFAVERYFESTDKNREIGAPPLWEFATMDEARQRVPRYFDLAAGIDAALAVPAPEDVRGRLDALNGATVFAETTSFPLFRSDGSRVTTLVLRAAGEYGLRFALPKSGLELVLSARGEKWVFALGRFHRAHQFEAVVGTTAGHTSRAQKSLFSEALEPLLAALGAPAFLNYWDEPPKAAELREVFNRAAWTVRTDNRGRVPITLPTRLGQLGQIDIPAVLVPDALYTVKVEWFRAGGYVLSLEGKDGVHAFALGRFRRAVFARDDRRSVSATLLGIYPNRTEMRAAVHALPSLLLRRADLAGRQRIADPALISILPKGGWVLTNTRGGKYLWDDPFEDVRWHFHGVGERGREHRVRIHVVDGIGAVSVFEYEGSENVKSRFKIYSRFTPAARRNGAREVQIFPHKGVYFHPDEVARAIGGMKPAAADPAAWEGVPDSPEKMQRALERLVMAYTPPAELRGAGAMVFPLEGPRATRGRGRSSGRFLVSLNRNGVAGFSEFLSQRLGEFAEVRSLNGGRDLHVIYHGGQTRSTFLAHIRLSPGRLLDALVEWSEELLQINWDERLKLQAQFQLNADANGDSGVRILRMIERAWLVRQYFNRLGPLSAQFERPEAGELNYRFKAWSYVNSDAFLSSEKKLRAILARIKTVLTDSDKAEYEKRLLAKVRSQKPLSAIAGKVLAAGTMILMGSNALGAETALAVSPEPLGILVSAGAALLVWAAVSVGRRVMGALKGAVVPPPPLAERTVPLDNQTVAALLADMSPGPRDMAPLEVSIDWRRVPTAARREDPAPLPSDRVEELDALARGDARVLSGWTGPDLEERLTEVSQAALARAAEGDRSAWIAGAALGARDGLRPERAAARLRWSVAAWAAAVKERPAAERTQNLAAFEKGYNTLRREVLRARAVGAAVLGRDAVVDLTPLFEPGSDEARAVIGPMVAILLERLRSTPEARVTFVVRTPVDRGTVEKTLAALVPGGAAAPRATLLLASEKEGASHLIGGRFSVAIYTEKRGRPGSLALVGFTPETLAESPEAVAALGARLVPFVKPLGDELENALRQIRFLAIYA
jgi:hypothetical protein